MYAKSFSTAPRPRSSSGASQHPRRRDGTKYRVDPHEAARAKAFWAKYDLLVAPAVENRRHEDLRRNDPGGEEKKRDVHVTVGVYGSGGGQR